MEVMPIDEALENGALAFFGDRYEDQVKVYTIGDFSKEVCGGPHVEHTGELGHFKIVKEQSSSSGSKENTGGIGRELKGRALKDLLCRSAELSAGAVDPAPPPVSAGHLQVSRSQLFGKIRNLPFRRFCKRQAFHRVPRNQVDKTGKGSRKSGEAVCIFLPRRLSQEGVSTRR